MIEKVFGKRTQAPAPPAQRNESPFQSMSDYERIIEIILAQAESFKRLKRESDAEKKFTNARGLGLEYAKSFPNSAYPMLASARISRLGGHLEFAEKLLDAAEALNKDIGFTGHVIAPERRRLRLEKDVAAGDQVAMGKIFVMYLCQHCGSLVEYISEPCIHCGWRPTTILETAYSVRLLSIAVDLSKLQFIGRAIKQGRNLKQIVPNLEEVVKADQADPKSLMFTAAKTAYDGYKDKQNDVYFSWRSVASCPVCQMLPLPWELKCSKCNSKLRLPPPLRLLLCFERLSTHIIYNVSLNEGGVDELVTTRTRTTDEWFLHYFVSLHSKLCRTQETPSDRERKRVLEFLQEIGEIRIANGIGKVILLNPRDITYEVTPGLPAAENQQATVIAGDLSRTFTYMAEWMMRSKALC